MNKCVSPIILFKTVKKLLMICSVPERDSSIIADSIVFADLRGIESHGISRLPQYLRRINHGAHNAKTELETIVDKGSIMLLDANNGFGQVAGYEAVQECSAKAKNEGIGLIGIRNSNNFGAANYYISKLIDKDQCGIVFSNAAPSIPPYGGLTAILGANPLAIGVPSYETFPLMLDMSMTMVAKGKIRLKAARNEKIPLDWASDKNGNPTDDPKKAMEGFLNTIGGPKGYGLALFIDILAGILTGSGFGKSVNGIYSMDPMNVGHIIMSIDISQFMPLNIFKEKVKMLTKQIRGSELAVGNERIYLPGELGFVKYKNRMLNGIPIQSTIYEELRDISSELKVKLDF